ncbi:recombinase family protein [Pseudolysinimonas sp.]
MNAVIYARQSLDRDGEGAAVERQLSECRRHAAAHKIKISREFIDNDISASKGNRPEFTRMLSLVRAGEIDTIVTWHTDRLYRRLRDLTEIVEVAEKHPVRIVTVRAGEMDLSTPAGRMSAGMLGQVARYEVEQKGARQVAANVQRAKKGIWQFSNRPYGYERVAGEVRVVEAEAKIMREGYERFLAGETLYAIVQSWNARGLLTQTGKPWTVSILSARLSNPAYAGILFYRGEEVGPGNWEAIVPRSTWEAFKTTQNRRRKPGNWTNRAKYLLSGLASCGVCGGLLLSRPDYSVSDVAGGPRVTYVCTDRWCIQRDRRRMDELVEGIVIARLSQPDASRLLRPKIDTAPLHREADELRQRKDDLAAALAEGLLTLASVRQESNKLSQRLAAIEEQIESAADASGLDEVIRSGDVEATWRSLTLGKKRAIISTLMSITVSRQKNTRVFDPNDVAITWSS